jgi:hypothetical protein
VMLVAIQEGNVLRAYSEWESIHVLQFCPLKHYFYHDFTLAVEKESYRIQTHFPRAYIRCSVTLIWSFFAISIIM